MHTFKALALLLGAAVLPSVSAIVTSQEVFDSIPRPPKGWDFHREAKADEPLTLRVSLREQNLDSLEKLFWEISDPEHENYGNHLEGHVIDKLVKPAEESAGAVVDWLRSHSIKHISVEDSWVSFTTTVGNANKLLGTDFQWFKNDERREAHIRTTKYSVPSHIMEHINFVSPTLKFPGIRKMSSNINKIGDSAIAKAYSELTSGVSDMESLVSNTTCNQTITPQCLLNLYNVHYGAKNNSILAYASFLTEYARYTDLAEFETTIAPYAIGKNFSVIQFNGGGNDQTSTNDSTEANLDNQYVTGVGYPLSITEFSTGGCGPLIPDQDEAAGSCGNEPYAQFLSGVLALPNSKLPATLSISYGEDEQTWPVSQAKSVCQQFMKLGARGVSILVASGDSGPGNTCENNNGSKSQFVPNFPASCPYVTTVGATYHINPESAVSFSGGGFSNYFAQPSYQSAAVKGYLSKLGSKFKGYYNASGRAYPDVSAQGVNFLVVDKGVTEPVDGTSASTPAFSAVIALLNSARIASGAKPLGFLNPFLYGQGASGLTDITTGSSSGCTAGKAIPGAGFAAVSGWDASTGLGTPNFGKLLAIAAPKQCNVGGVVPNPTKKSCSSGASAPATVSAPSTLATTAKTAATTKMAGKPTGSA